MTKEELEITKQRIKEEITILKRDYERINNIITMLGEFIEKGTPENIDDYIRQVVIITNSLESIKL